MSMWDGNPHAFIKQFGITEGIARRFQCTAEHVVARRDGGKDEGPNIVAACLFCNRTRHKARHPEDATQYANTVRSRLARGGWHPSQVIAALGKRSEPDI